MNVFISGGCKNGKSYFAQRVVKAMAKKKMYYIATMIPGDNEDRERINRHIADRDGWGFETVEQGRNICGALNGYVDREGAFLLDSVTALLSNEMFDENGNCNFDAGEKVADDLVQFARETGNTVFVSDYIYSGAAQFDDYTENYRKALAMIDRRLTEVCETVVEVTYGQILYHKGKKLI